MVFIGLVRIGVHRLSFEQDAASDVAVHDDGRTALEKVVGVRASKDRRERMWSGIRSR